MIVVAAMEEDAMEAVAMEAEVLEVVEATADAVDEADVEAAAAVGGERCTIDRSGLTTANFRVFSRRRVKEKLPGPLVDCSTAEVIAQMKIQACRLTRTLDAYGRPSVWLKAAIDTEL